MKNLKFSLRAMLTIGILILLIDQITKRYFLYNSELVDLIILKFQLVKNYGFAGGLFSQSSPLVRLVFFSTLGSYLFLFYFIALYFLRNKQLFRLKVAFSLFIFGILGNVIDKVTNEFVIDFIIVNIPILKSYAFNIADICIFFGTILLICSLYVDYDEIWIPNDKRRTYLINNEYQLRTAFVLGVGVVLFCLTLTIFSYSFLTSYLSVSAPTDTIVTYLLGVGIILFLFLLISTLFVIIFTHRSAGPIKAFLRFSQSDEKILKLRKGDFFTNDLQEIIKNLGK
jgi:signal peptidase II